jgi:ribosome biogenesis GTPase / thiamine phosphate phosphatase
MNTPFDATVIAAYGRHLLIRDAEGRESKARPFGRRLSVVCGDGVRCEVDPRHGEVHVVEVLKRRTALYRSNVRAESEPIVANLSKLLVVLAPLPEPDLFVVDRYISAAASASIAALLVVNKVDRGVDDSLRAELEAFARAGYEYVECSVKSGQGIDVLLRSCASETAALVGQSGVGKSSLVGKLVPDVEVATGELMREEEGRHTTTASRMFDLPGGGHLIDSPGVRDFAPALDCLEPTTLGFIEVARLAPQCRFDDCRHIREPGCAVAGAALSGELHPRRYESYRRLRRLADELIEARGPGKRDRN